MSDQFVRPCDLHAYTEDCDDPERGGGCVRVVPGPAYDALAALVREWHEYRASEPQDAAP